MAGEAQGAGWAVPAAASVTFVWLELLRVWFPSVLFVIGTAGSTSALVMGAFALGSLAIPLVVALWMNRLPIHAVWLAGGSLLAVGRFAIMLTDGGMPQAWVSTIAVVGGATALAALAAGTVDGHAARLGFLFGLLASVAVHATLRTQDLVWDRRAGAWLAAAVLVVALVVVLVRHAEELRGAGHSGRAALSAASGPGWPWLVLAPLMLLVLILSGVPGRVSVAAPAWSPSWVVAGIVLVHGSAVVVAVVASRLEPEVAGPTGGGLVLIGTALALQADGVVAIAGQGAIALGVAAVIGSLRSVEGASGPRGRATAASGAVLLFGVLAFAYYATYDIALPISNRTFLLIGGLIGAAIGGAAALSATVTRIRPRLRSAPLAGAVAAVLVIATLSTVAMPEPRTSSAPAAAAAVDEGLRVVVYNLHMGFDPEGRFSAQALAEVLREQSPDVVVLNEVDRGWLTTGGHDLLELVAADLGLTYRFAPAADEVWGNALLTRFPISRWSWGRLPRGNDPMRRSQFAAVIDVAEDRQLAVVGTHLSHIDEQGDTRPLQARAVAATAARLRERDLPTIVVGDLNAEPGDPELAVFDALGMVGVGGPDVATFPSWAPEVHIDHLLLSPDLVATEVEIPSRQASDHLPVAITVRPAPAP